MSRQFDHQPSGRVPSGIPRVSADEANRNARLFLKGADLCGAVTRLAAASPYQIPDSPEGQFSAFTRRIARQDAFYNLVYCYGTRPVFPGVTLETGELLEPTFTEELVKLCPGGLIRPNAVLGNGSGKFGCHCDSDIASHDYLLIESDCLPIPLQAAVLSRLIEHGLPIISAVYTGGKSIHALISVQAADPTEFRTLSRRTYSKLVRLGFDPSTGNCSRMTRLPGCVRTLSDESTALQRLLYLA